MKFSETTRHLALSAALLAAAAIAPAAQAAVAAFSEKVNYNVEYRWGFIRKIAAHGTATAAADASGRFTASLAGRSIPWSGRVYCVSDTIAATMGTSPANPALPSAYVTHLNGLYYKPFVADLGGFDLSNPSNYWDTDGRGTLGASVATQEAVSITADMLTMFYFAKALDFPSMAEGTTVTLPVTYADGRAATQATLTYGGEQTVNVGPCEVDCYAMVVNFTYNGSPSAYPVHFWVSRQGRIPVVISAAIAIGQMEMVAEL